MTPRRASILALLLFLFAGCATSSSAPPTRGDIIRRILPSTVQLRAEREGGGRRAGSGVVVAVDPGTDRAWVATTQHFLDPPAVQRILVRRPGHRQTATASVRFASPEHDLAILEVAGLAIPRARLKAEAALGDDVWIVAFPWGGRATVTSGVVSQISSADGTAPFAGAPRMIDASVSYGASGGGVFDAASGALIGLVEGFRTARVALPDAPSRTLEVPVAGETTVIATAKLLEVLAAAGLLEFVQK